MPASEDKSFSVIGSAYAVWRALVEAELCYADAHSRDRIVDAIALGIEVGRQAGLREAAKHIEDIERVCATLRHALVIAPAQHTELCQSIASHPYPPNEKCTCWQKIRSGALLPTTTDAVTPGGEAEPKATDERGGV